MPNLLTTLHLHGSTQGVPTGRDAARPTVGARLERAAATHKVLGSSRTRPLERLHTGSPLRPLLLSRACSQTDAAGRPAAVPAGSRSLMLQQAAAASFAHLLPAPCAPQLLSPSCTPPHLAPLRGTRCPRRRSARRRSLAHLCPAVAASAPGAPPMVSWMAVRLVGRTI
jgi:hypothetical protein